MELSVPFFARFPNFVNLCDVISEIDLTLKHSSSKTCQRRKIYRSKYNILWNSKFAFPVPMTSLKRSISVRGRDSYLKVVSKIKIYIGSFTYALSKVALSFSRVPPLAN